MSRPFAPKVVTANHLLDGDVIYLAANDNWVRDLEDADVLYDEADAQLRLLLAQSQPQVVVDAYLVDVTPGRSGPQPTHFHEDFRRTGPSNYAHGKQEAQSDV